MPSEPHPTDENWPDGYIFRAIDGVANYRAYDDDDNLLRPPDNHAGPVILYEGEAGVILRSSMNPISHSLDWVDVRTADDQRGRLGAAAIDRLEITQRKCGDIKIHMKSVSGSLQLDTHALKASPLHAAVTNVMLGWHTHKDDIHFFKQKTWNALGDRGQHISRLADEYIYCVKNAGALHALEKANFNFFDLANIKSMYESGCKDLGGVYLRLYWNVRDHPNKAFIYTGSTFKFSERDEGHNNAANNPSGDAFNCPHYQIYRKAGQHKMVPIAAAPWFNQKSPDVISKRELFEEVTVALFNSYAQPNPSSDASTSVLQTFLDAENAMVNFWSRRDNKVRAMNEMATESHGRSGWPSAVGRPNFAPARHTATFGFNIEPILGSRFGSHRMKTLWIRTEAEIPGIGQVVNLKRAMCCTITLPLVQGEKHDNPQNFVMVMNARSTGGTSAAVGAINFSAPPPPIGPPLGTEVNLTLEVRVDGKSHPNSYVRVPTVGPFKDWTLANSVAVRINWANSSGRRVGLFLTKDRNRARFTGSSTRGLSSGYVYGKWLRQLALGQKIIPAPQRLPEDPVPYSLFIKSVEIDFFNQAAKLSDRLPLDLTALPSAERLDDTEIARMLTDCGLENAGLLPGEVQFTFPRGSCDLCYLSHYAGEDCVKHEIGNCCKVCYDYGIVCSWTEDLGGASWRGRAFNYDAHIRTRINAILGSPKVAKQFDEAGQIIQIQELNDDDEGAQDEGLEDPDESFHTEEIVQ